MCAIMGVFQKDQKEVELTVLGKMQNALRHRGPDDAGLHTFSFGSTSDVKNCGVAFDRLSIRDLSANGHQPMFDASNQVMIAFNGEIYNSEELRPELLQDGVKFRGHSDTEVILNLYLKYGIDKTLALLDGMFAICILDARMQKIYLVRDRIGEKPLYIYQNNNVLMFASEFKAFYAHPEFKPVLNEDVVDEYFLFRYSSDNQTILGGVNNLEAGTYLEFSNEFTPKTHVYWTIPAKKKNHNSFEENKRIYDELFRKSVKRRLISDVPVGIQLSGGVDSSYLAYVARQNVKEAMHAYSIVFDAAYCSEEKYIDYVTSKVDFNLHKFNFKSADFLKWWKISTYYFESPANHEGTLALGLINHEAKKDITVMLCGDGPDETMGGYSRFYAHEVAARLKSTPGGIGLKIWNALLKYKGKQTWNTSIDTFIGMSQFIPSPIFRRLRPWREDGVEHVYNKRRAIYEAQSGTGMRKLLNYEMYTYMRDIQMRTDKISMASSIEVRVPYLMPELLEFISSVPDNQLVGNSIKDIRYGTRYTKMLLKSLSEDVYGTAFTYRPKLGLGFPFNVFFNQPDVVEYVENELLPKVEKRGIVNYEAVLNLWKERKAFMALWTVFSFEIWAEMYLDGNPLDVQISLIN